MAAVGVVVLGKGTLAVRVSDWFLRHPDYELLRVVPVMPEPDWTDSLTGWARTERVPVVATGDYRDLPLESAELGLSVFYDRILSQEFIDRFDTLLNVHNSPLPRYRGVAPINWALKNGERRHGVTIHEIASGIDDGPIVAQLEYSIYPEFDEVVDVYERALEYGWALFQQTLPLLERIEPRPQNHALATYYSACDRRLLGERAGFTRELSVNG